MFLVQSDNTRYNRELSFASVTEDVTIRFGSFDRHIVYLSIYNGLFLAYEVMYKLICLINLKWISKYLRI